LWLDPLRQTGRSGAKLARYRPRRTWSRERTYGRLIPRR
jgi:hypothetical protein